MLADGSDAEILKGKGMSKWWFRDPYIPMYVTFTTKENAWEKLKGQSRTIFINFGN